jgi:Protein of unknown function (DUF4058)
LAVPEGIAQQHGPYDYLVSVNRARPPRFAFELYPIGLRDCIVLIRVPLADGDTDVTLDLKEVLTKLYDIGSYRDRLNYETPCVPPLSPEDQEWANQLIRQAPATTNGV